METFPPNAQPIDPQQLLQQQAALLQQQLQLQQQQPVQPNIPQSVPAPAVSLPGAPAAAAPSASAPSAVNLPNTVVNASKTKFKLHYSKFEAARVTCTPLARRAIPGKEGQYYHIIPLFYNLGTTEVPIFEELAIEGPSMVSDFGIAERPAPETGKLGYSIGFKLMASNPEHAKFITVMRQIHHMSLQMMNHYKASPFLPAAWRQFNPLSPGTSFKNPIYTTLDDRTGDPMKGAPVGIYFKIFKSGSGNAESRSLFTNLRGEPLDWNLLISSEIHCCPVVVFDKIYIGSTASTQSKVRSAFVTSVTGRNTQTSQMDTIQDYVQAHPEAVDQLDAQLAKLTIERQNKMAAAQKVPFPGAPTMPNESTFAPLGGAGPAPTPGYGHPGANHAMTPGMGHPAQTPGMGHGMPAMTPGGMGGGMPSFGPIDPSAGMPAFGVPAMGQFLDSAPRQFN